MISEFRKFLQAFLQIFLPKPPKKLKLPRVLTRVNPHAPKWDDYLHDGKPVRIKGKIPKRKK